MSNGHDTNGCQRRKSSRHINQVPLVHQDVLRLGSENKTCNLLHRTFSAEAAKYSLDPVELGAIGKVSLVGNDKCEGEEGGDGSRLFGPSYIQVEVRNESEGYI